jgi:hypothetical protein
VKFGPVHALSLGTLLVAGGVAYLAMRSQGPVPLSKFTELRPGPLMEHLVTAEELISKPVWAPITYPSRTCTNLNLALNHGLAPQWKVPDPQAAALPSEAMW